MPAAPIPSWYFALSVVRSDDRFLLVQEHKHGQLWSLPAGHAEPTETLADAALRETREEAGILVRLSGIYRVEHTPVGGGARVRVIFGAEPVDETPPKQTPDHHSLRAGWFSLAEIAKLPLRSSAVLRLLCDIRSGAPLHPLSLLAAEGQPLSLA